jgi:ATP-dependent DNA ligase
VPPWNGIVAKRRDAEYRPGERTAVQKVKNYRSADCVVGDFRYGTARQDGRLAAARAL